MSNFYLCDTCGNYRRIEREYDCDGWCVAGGKPKKVMHDGIERPTDVCEHYVARIGEACTERT